MADVAGGDSFRAGDGDDGFADDNTVHGDGVAGSEVASGEFMFCGNIRGKSEIFASKVERLAAPKIDEGDNDVVARIYAKSGSGHGPRLQAQDVPGDGGMST